MLREVRFRDLDRHERARWARALQQTALLADRPRRIDPGACTLGALGITAIGLLSTLSFHLELEPWSELEAHIAWGSLWAGSVGMLSALAVRARRIARAPFPVGRFLYPWGYAEVSADRVRFVRGAELQQAASVGPPRLSGASRIVIALSTREGWSTRFRFVGCDLDVPHEGLAALATTSVDLVGGYRDPSQPALGGRRAGWSPSPLLRIAAVSAIAALGGSLLPVGSAWMAAELAIQAVERHPTGLDVDRATALTHRYPYFGWVAREAERIRARAVIRGRARIDEELRQPYRDAVLAVLADGQSAIDAQRRCRISEADVARLTSFARGRAPEANVADYAPTFAGWLPFLEGYVNSGAPYRPGRARLVMQAECSVEPLWIVPGVRTRVAFRFRAEWQTELDGRLLTRRRLILEPDVISEVAACAPPDRDRGSAELHAAAGLLDLAMHADVFTSERDWYFPLTLHGYESVAPCVRSALSRLAIDREDGEQVRVALSSDARGCGRPGHSCPPIAPRCVEGGCRPQ